MRSQLTSRLSLSFEPPLPNTDTHSQLSDVSPHSFLEALKIHNKLLGTCQSVKYSRTCFLKVKMTSSTFT